MSAPEVALLVVGSGPAGISAASAFRDGGGVGRVLVVSADPHLPYERPPLSKDFLQSTSDADDTLLHDDAYYADRDIELLLGVEVRSLDASGRAVELADGRQLSFDACVLATGAAPARPDIPGADLPGVHVLRALDQALALRSTAANATRAVVVGSGFIGCEAAASLAIRGLAVTLVTDEDMPQAARLGPDVARRITGWLTGHGVDIRTGDGIAAITADPLQVRTAAGAVLPTDLVLLATGVRPAAVLAEAAGLRVQDGRIRVDSSMRTSADHVFAAGDVALATNDAAGRAVAVEHWGDAVGMGEIAGRNAAGGSERWAQAPGFWSTIGDRTLKYTAWGDGYDETRLRAGTGGAFTAFYLRDARVVGVLSHDHDEDYDRGEQWVTEGSPVAALGLA